MNKQLRLMGEEFSFTAEQTYEAGARMAQMGAVIGKGNIVAGTRLGIQFALISGLETEAAMRRLTNLQQQTGFMIGDKLTKQQFQQLSVSEQRNVINKETMSVLDQLNTIENRSIATMDQLTFTMNQFAAQAHMTGSSISEMAAMSATMIEAGEQQGPAGRALRMMYARLGGDIGGARTKLEEMG